MRAVERELLTLLSSCSVRALSTTEIISSLYPSCYTKIQTDLSASDSAVRKRAQHMKSALHKRLLYYLNKLKQTGVIEEAGIIDRGEKTYRCTYVGEHVLLRDKQETIVVTQEVAAQNYLHDEDLFGLTCRNNQLHKISAYAINAKAYVTFASMRKQLLHLYTHISDSLLVYQFHRFLSLSEVALDEAIDCLISDSNDYSLRICLHFDIRLHALTQAQIRFFSLFAKRSPKRLSLLFSLNKEQLSCSAIQKIFSLLAREQIKICIASQNELHFPGSEGSYVLISEQQSALECAGGVIVASGSYLVDFTKQKNLRAKSLQELVLRIAKTLLARMITQRRIATRTLTGLSQVGALREQLVHPVSYIRLWNYLLEDTHLELVAQLRETIRAFMHIHQRILESCGVPLAFSVHLSTGFLHYAPGLSARRYRKQTVYGKESLFAQPLELREQLMRIYDTDRIRFFRDASVRPEELINELHYLMQRYSYPLLVYDFKTLQRTRSLEEFL